MEGLVPRFELDTPRVNSEAPIGLIKKTSTQIKNANEASYQGREGPIEPATELVLIFFIR